MRSGVSVESSDSKRSVGQRRRRSALRDALSIAGESDPGSSSVERAFSRAVLDSGTGSIAVDKALANSLGIKLGASIGQIPGGDKPEPMFPLILDKIDFGPEHLEHVSAIALSLDHLSASSGFPVDVLLGHPVFADRSVLVNYPDRKIFFFRAGAEPRCYNPVPLSFWGGDPVVSVTLKATPASEPVPLHLIVDLEHGTSQQ